jgi:hypothetical protein
LWRSRWNVDWQGKPKFSEKNLPQRLFCPSQNATLPDPGLNLSRRGGKPATNRQIGEYGEIDCEKHEIKPTNLNNYDSLAFTIVK